MSSIANNGRYFLREDVFLYDSYTKYPENIEAVIVKYTRNLYVFCVSGRVMKFSIINKTAPNIKTPRAFSLCRDLHAPMMPNGTSIPSARIAESMMFGWRAIIICDGAFCGNTASWDTAMREANTNIIALISNFFLFHSICRATKTKSGNEDMR